MSIPRLVRLRGNPHDLYLNPDAISAVYWSDLDKSVVVMVGGDQGFKVAHETPLDFIEWLTEHT